MKSGLQIMQVKPVGGEMRKLRRQQVARVRRTAGRSRCGPPPTQV